jgi:hypothetical protein
MKRKILTLLLLSLLLIGASPVRTVRLTVVNKSGLPVDVSLTGKYLENTYYLRVPEGDKLFPEEKHIDLIPDMYSMSIYYVEFWDPVYGYDCTEGGKSVAITHSTRLTFLGCTYTPPNNGEPPAMLKYPQGAGGGGRRMGR